MWFLIGLALMAIIAFITNPFGSILSLLKILTFCVAAACGFALYMGADPSSYAAAGILAGAAWLALQFVPHPRH